MGFVCDAPLCCCRECGCELFGGEIYYDMAQFAVCRDCLPQFARRYFSCRRRVMKTAGRCM
ncbi:MAG: hypothetical protein IJT18_00790 [Oscillospiraceae bacterium]|nr:hypothetical protein [Oscillospiraceae bacterium]